MYRMQWSKKKEKIGVIYLSLKNEIQFTVFTYFGIAVSVVSGVLTARYLGASARGTLAYYSNYILLVCYVSSFNLSSGTARVLSQINNNSTKNNGTTIVKIFILGFLLSTTLASIIVLSGKIDSNNMKIYLFFILSGTGMAAISSYFEGIWTYMGNLKLIAAARFIGLFIPAAFAIVLVLINKATIGNLLLSQLLVLVANMTIIYNFIKNTKQLKLPDIQVILRSAIRGMPAYLIEYLSFWIVTFTIMQIDGATALGYYAIASSLTSAADSIYGASRVKFYKLLLNQNIRNFQSLSVILTRSTAPSILLHLIFIPLSFLIPIIYGDNFYPAQKIAIFLLISRTLTISARTIVLYLISIKQDILSILVYLSFLISFLIISHFSETKIFGYHWTFCYLCASLIMLVSSLVFLYFLSINKKYYLKI